MLLQEISRTMETGIVDDGRRVGAILRIEECNLKAYRACLLKSILPRIVELSATPGNPLTAGDMQPEYTTCLASWASQQQVGSYG